MRAISDLCTALVSPPSFLPITLDIAARRSANDGLPTLAALFFAIGEIIASLPTMRAKSIAPPSALHGIDL